MAQPYVGEIRMFAGNFAPAGWMFCQGQLLSIDASDIPQGGAARGDSIAKRRFSGACDSGCAGRRRRKPSSRL